MRSATGGKSAEIAERKILNTLEKIERGGVKSEHQFWKKTTEFRGNKVYQRDDLIDPMKLDAKGRTNLSLMKKGKPPIGPDGEKMNAHHMLQTQKGPIAEMTETFHQKYTKVIHINPNTIPSGINRNKFDYWRKEYWRNRAKDFE